MVFTEAYPTGNKDFSAIPTITPDAFGAATRGLDAVAVTRQIKQLDMNPRMYAVTIGGALPKFYEVLGRNAEFVYGPSQWEPELVTLRAGGLIPIARHYPGPRENPHEEARGPAPQRAHGGPRCCGVRASAIRPRTTAPRCRRARCDARVAQAFELATQR